MRLTQHTDYALRVLIYLATHEGQLCAIGEIAKAYRISRNHLMKVANTLSREGFVISARGRGGGLKLARPAAKIKVGDVVRKTEESLALADCGSCVIAPACDLIPALAEGVQALLATLDRYTVADLMAKRRRLAAILGKTN